jgi:hypothetical protein
MSQNIYPIQLLNDLHNHFPDVLYNPGRFRNIQDLLEYIRSVADVNPFTHGLRQYNSHQSLASRTNQLRASRPPANTNTTAQTSAFNINSTFNPFLRASMFDVNNVPLTHIEFPINSESAANISTLLSGPLSELFGIPSVNIQSFFDQRVPIVPTQEQIQQATTVYTANEPADEVCSICQDQVEVGQQVRRLNHCNHIFHSHCIDTWFARNMNCPTCRHDIRETQGSNNASPPVPQNHRRTDIRHNES